jgi:hypothetical protein
MKSATFSLTSARFLVSSDHQQLFVGEPAQRAALVDSLSVRAPLAQLSRQAGGVHLVEQQLHA